MTALDRLSPSAKVPDRDAGILRRHYTQAYEAGRDWRQKSESLMLQGEDSVLLSFWVAAEAYFRAKEPSSQLAKLAFQAGWERP